MHQFSVIVMGGIFLLKNILGVIFDKAGENHQVNEVRYIGKDDKKRIYQSRTADHDTYCHRYLQVSINTYISFIVLKTDRFTFKDVRELLAKDYHP